MAEKDNPPEPPKNNLDFIKNILPEVVTAIVVTVIIGGAEKIAQGLLLIPTSVLAIIVILLFSAFNKTNKKSRKWLVVGSGIAMIAGFSISAIAINNSSVEDSCANPMTNVFVVTNKIQQGSYITENDLYKFPIPSGYVIDSYILSQDEIIGQIAKVDIPEYSMITKSMLTIRSNSTP